MVWVHFSLFVLVIHALDMAILYFHLSLCILLVLSPPPLISLSHSSTISNRIIISSGLWVDAGDRETKCKKKKKDRKGRVGDKEERKELRDKTVDT